MTPLSRLARYSRPWPARHLPTRLKPVSMTVTVTTTTTTTRKMSGKREEDEEWRIDTDRGEYSKSGGDSEVAAQQCSYEVRYHDPADVLIASDLEGSRSSGGGRDTGRGHPLEVSPANTEVSRFTDEGGGHHPEGTPSRRVSPRKGKRVDYGGADLGR